jgi:histidine ammonia-lyase
VRRRLPAGATLFTGDDFHYVSLIEGDELGHSDALLGAFAAVAPSAALALAALDRGDVGEYRRILDPTEALARQIFAAPTPFYKTGVAFMSWLNGHQPAFAMVGGLHSARSLVHLSEIVRLADAAGALERPDLAAERWGALLHVNGLGR